MRRIELNKNDIYSKKYLPHRGMWALLEGVIFEKYLLNDEYGCSLKGAKFITNDDCDGHFNIFPGCLIQEMMVQAGALMYLLSGLIAIKEEKPVLRRIEEIDFLGPVFPGDLLEVEVHVLQKKGKFCYFEAMASVGNRKVAKAERIIGALEKITEKVPSSAPEWAKKLVRV